MKNSNATLIFVCVLGLMGCAHGTVYTAADSSTAITDVLDQVNDAVNQAKANVTDAPDVTSVEVDLQVGTSTSAGGSTNFPLGIIFPSGQLSNDRLHKISLSFAPRSELTTLTTVHHNAALTSAIEKIYQAVASAGQHYQFQRGSMQIQCTFASNLSLSTNQSGGGGSSSRSPQSQGQSSSAAPNSGAASSSSVVLLPIQLDASVGNQLVQTVTLTFAPKALTPPATEPPPSGQP